ncbi:MFS general substrate transporter [Lophium mytilinum]|uniref:MFS general substrate transporter n=1 Tax=Lophium mytilinum TaxID=390894 RepID=A0A6A6QCT0_9PEZI|nr:MFS general substrate transporter [Lophium mytilinum]
MVDQTEVAEGRFIPGTALLVDDAGQEVGKHAGGKHTEIVLIPPPSDDPNDPLNWSMNRKRLQLTLMCLYTFILNGFVNFYGVAYVGLSTDLKISFNGLNVGSALLFLFSGIGAAFWQPVAMKFGRRPVYIIGLIITMVGSIVGATQKDFNIWCVFNVIWGLGCGPKEGLPQISLQDTYFAHEMGAKVGYWALCYSAGAFITPLVAGYVYVQLSWRWCFWITAIGMGALAILLFFTLEETLYPRTFSTEGVSPSVSGAGSTSEKSDPDAVSSDEKGAVTVSTALPSQKKLKTFWEARPLHVYGINPGPSWRDLFFRPWILATFPPVLWAGFFAGVSVCWWAAIFTTQSEFFSAPPYLWSGESVGLTNAAALIGSILGTIFAGNISDWWVLGAARRNKGVREPEQRLSLLLVTAIITAGGLNMYGYGVWHGVHWTCPVFGMGLMAFGFTACSIIAETYVLDSYRAVAAEALVLLNIFRNLIGMTFVFAIQPWLDHSGWGNAYVQMMALAIITHLTVIPMMMYGKKLRAGTSEKYLKMLADSGIPVTYA